MIRLKGAGIFRSGSIPPDPSLQHQNSFSNRDPSASPIPSLYDDDQRAFRSINTILSSSFRLRRSTSHTKGDQSSSAFSSCSLFALACCRLGIDLQSSRRIQCCARCSSRSCSGCRSVGRNRRMGCTRDHNPSIRGLRRLRGVGEAMLKSVRVCCVTSAGSVTIWKDGIESARAWKREFFLSMKHVGMVKKDRRTFSLNSAPHTASQRLTNKALFNTEAIKYL